MGTVLPVTVMRAAARGQCVGGLQAVRVEGGCVGGRPRGGGVRVERERLASKRAHREDDKRGDERGEKGEASERSREQHFHLCLHRRLRPIEASADEPLLLVEVQQLRLRVDDAAEGGCCRSAHRLRRANAQLVRVHSESGRPEGRADGSRRLLESFEPEHGERVIDHVPVQLQHVARDEALHHGRRDEEQRQVGVPDFHGAGNSAAVVFSSFASKVCLQREREEGE